MSDDAIILGDNINPDFLPKVGPCQGSMKTMNDDEKYEEALYHLELRYRSPDSDIAYPNWYVGFTLLEELAKKGHIEARKKFIFFHDFISLNLISARWCYEKLYSEKLENKEDKDEEKYEDRF